MKSKSAEDYLEEAYVKIRALQSSEHDVVDPILLEAMEAYAAQSKWVDVETLPNDQYWYRVLIDGKHDILPASYVGGGWWFYGESHPTPRNVTHYQSFEDLPTPPTP